MNTLHDKAYKLAASFFLSSMHDDWSGSRIRNAILADEDSGHHEALADQQQLEVWTPIDEFIQGGCHPMANPYEELDDIIDNLADAFMQFAKENSPTIRRVVVEHDIFSLDDGSPLPPIILPAGAFGDDFDKYEGDTLLHEEGSSNGVPVRYKQTFMYTKRTDEQLLEIFKHKR